MGDLDFFNAAVADLVHLRGYTKQLATILVWNCGDWIPTAQAVSPCPLVAG